MDQIRFNISKEDKEAFRQACQGRTMTHMLKRYVHEVIEINKIDQKLTDIGTKYFTYEGPRSIGNEFNK